MTLIYKCVICEEKIKNPRATQFTCGKEDCKKKYGHYLVALKRKIFKELNTKDFKEDEKNVEQQ